MAENLVAERVDNVLFVCFDRTEPIDIRKKLARLTKDISRENKRLAKCYEEFALYIITYPSVLQRPGLEALVAECPDRYRRRVLLELRELIRDTPYEEFKL